MKKVFAMLLAVLLLSSMACGRKVNTVETQETAAPVATEAPKAEVEAVRQAGPTMWWPTTAPRRAPRPIPIW